MTLWHLEMSQNITKCHTFSHLWYKARSTFYVWIWLGTTLRVGLSPNGLPASRFRDKWQIWDEKRKTCFSPSRIVTFVPIQKKFSYLRGLKCDVFREGVWQKTSPVQKKKIRVRDRHILPRNVTNVTRHIFCHRKKWQMWRHSPKSETGTWEQIGLRPTLRSRSRDGLGDYTPTNVPVP